MIVHVKRDGDRIPVECAGQEKYDELVRIHGKDNVELPEGFVGAEAETEPTKKRGK